MNWNSIGELLAMGGYASYVWGAFGMTALSVAGEIWLLRRRHRRARQALAPMRGGRA